jgi:alanyl-tRNA synthetase
MNITEISQRFVGYYEKMGYQLLPSAPMIDPSIPMSFVMSAGLVQVENSLAKVTHREGNQYVLVQSCFRHFDLEKVGTDDIHLSLFEMPGAFVFGPNGRNSTVQRMWHLAIDVLKIDKEQIWVSYFNGGEVAGSHIEEDVVTRQAWTNTGVQKDHIIGLGAEHNYWIQGKGIDDTSITRKCGPNTELFYDRGSDRACGKDCRPGCRCGRFIEFSNSLFICSELGRNNGRIQPLDNPFTETVIGAERVNMILCKTSAVFDIEEFRPVIRKIRSLASAGNLQETLVATSERVIADHLRGLFCLIAGGAPPPGKNGRERIVKMLIRRVITRLIVLGIDIEKAMPLLVGATSESITNIEDKQAVSNTLIDYFFSEHTRFQGTLSRGRHQLIRFLKENGNNSLTGKQIIILEKKWGFPSLLIKFILQEQGFGHYEVVQEIKFERN